MFILWPFGWVRNSCALSILFGTDSWNWEWRILDASLNIDGRIMRVGVVCLQVRVGTPRHSVETWCWGIGGRSCPRKCYGGRCKSIYLAMMFVARRSIVSLRAARRGYRRCVIHGCINDPHPLTSCYILSTYSLHWNPCWWWDDHPLPYNEFQPVQRQSRFCQYGMPDLRCDQHFCHCPKKSSFCIFLHDNT